MEFLIEFLHIGLYYIFFTFVMAGVAMLFAIFARIRK
jgi:hypothetical protein